MIQKSGGAPGWEDERRWPRLEPERKRAALFSTLRPFNRARVIVEGRSPAGAVLL
jgi:hypothetical protein